MKAGIIAEYNPFHTGHKYQIDQLREQGAHTIVVAMSGNYVQRGEPAVLDKFLRAKMALGAGVDMVVEMPLASATSSAEEFASCGVEILDSLGCDAICFGVKCDNLEMLQLIADTLACESEEYKSRLTGFLKDGMSFPVARERALGECLNVERDGKYQIFHDIISEPNNILAIEYLKAMRRIGSKMQPIMLQRQGAGYNDEKPKDGYASASYVRSKLQKVGKESASWSALDELLAGDGAYLTKDSLSLMREEPWFLSPDDFSHELYKAIISSRECLDGYQGVSRELSDRIDANICNYKSYQSFAELLKTKNMTRTGINRALLHIMLGMQDDMRESAVILLGVRKERAELISEAKKGLGDRLVVNWANDGKMVTKEAIDADYLYYGVRAMKYSDALIVVPGSNYLLKV